MITNNALKKLIYVVVLFPMVAFANGETPVSSGFKFLIDAMLGPTGIAIATVAIIGAGLGGLYGYIKWSTVVIIIASICVVFGAEPLASSIAAMVRGSGI